MITLAKKLFICTTALCSSASAADGPGLAVSFSEEGVNNAASILTPLIFKYFNNVTVPEIDIKGGWFKNITILVPTPDVKDIHFSFVPANNGLGLVATGIEAHVDADFKFKELFITATGKADIVIKKLSIDFELDASTQPGTGTSELAAKITIPIVKINVNPDDIDIKLTGGGLVTKIAAILIPLIKDEVIPSALKNLETIIQGKVTDTINTDLAKYVHIAIPALAGVTTDVAQLLGGPKFSDTKVFTMGVNGTSYDAKNVVAPAYHPASYNAADLQGKQLQTYLTDYAVNTALDAGFLTGNTLDITKLLGLLNVTVHTDQIGLIIPEILTKYGPGKNVSLAGKFITEASHTSISAAGAHADISLAVTVGVEGETCIFAPISHTLIQGIVSSKAGKVYGNLSQHTIGAFGAGFTTTLGMTADALQTELQTNVDTQVAKLNALLAAGIVIPKIFGIDISDVALESMDGYLSFGATVAPPAFWEYVAMGVTMIKEHTDATRLSEAMPEEVQTDDHKYSSLDLFLQ